MIKNKIERISDRCAKNIIEDSRKDKGNYLVTIRMDYINSWEKFAEAMGNAFQLPMRNEGFDGTRDWMEDLEWLGKQSYTLIFYNFSILTDIKLKDIIMKFLTMVLEWWEKDVIKYCIDGEAKTFNVYLVN